MGFSKAVRENVWGKVLLAGPSGSGKTYSALKLATGIASKSGGSGIAYIDTEAGRAKYYADQFDFDIMLLQEPYTPEKYIAAIDEAVSAGYKVICIDSLTHEWLYLNDVHSKMSGNSFTNWSQLKTRHKALMEKILQSPIHVVATARGKDAYVIDTNEKGKQTPRKVGEGIDGDKQLEYNYTCTFQLAQDTHVATVMKDNTHIFEGRYDVLTDKDGVALYDWCNSGIQPTTPPPQIVHAELDLESLISNIAKVAKDLADNGIPKTKIAEAVKKHHTSANYNTITDTTVAKAVLEELSNTQF